MDFEVDTDILRVTENQLYKNSNSFDQEIEEWKKQIERLKNVWSGEDADIFYTRIDEYLLKLKMVSETENIFGKALKQSYTTYEEQDEAFSTELKRDNEQYDDEAFLRETGQIPNVPKDGELV